MSTAEETLTSPLILTPRQRRNPVVFPEAPTDEEPARDWTLAEADKAAVLRCRTHRHQLSFAILRPREHSTDTHGDTEHLFGLCYLLGFSFMPRLRGLADQQLYKIDRGTAYGSLEPLFRGGIDAELIREQWDPLVRIASSLRQRTAPAHVVVQRLAGSSPSDRVAKALTALGRVVKTIYILRHLHEEDVRRRVQLQLNRGESRHDLARWLFFANQGEFRTGDYEEIMNKASCLSLLSNAVLVWNTVQMGEIVARLRAAGEVVSDEDLARISPLAYAHVIPNGTYVFDHSRRGHIAPYTLP
jgi:TnpA family transposase